LHAKKITLLRTELTTEALIESMAERIASMATDKVLPDTVSTQAPTDSQIPENMLDLIE
jgi:hypothetical protein